MEAFLVIGGLGLLLLALVLMLGDWLDALLPDIELGDGLFSMPVLAGFVAAFGFAGAALHSGTDGSTPVALAGGSGAGVVVAWFALRLTRGLINMPTDETLRTGDLVGSEGRVVTDIRDGSLGEVLVVHAGQSLKMSASADRPLACGEAVVIIESISPTAVRVSAAADFWAPDSTAVNRRNNERTEHHQ